MVSPIGPSGSDNTNVSSYLDLTLLRAVKATIAASFKEVTSGYVVADAFDDGSAYELAQGLRGNVSATAAVNQRLEVAKGVIAVGLQVGVNISQSLAQVQAVLIALADPNLTGGERSNYEAQYNTLKVDIFSLIQDATFNTTSIVEAQSTNISVISNIYGGVYTIRAQDLVNEIYDQLGNVTGSYSSAANLILSGGGFRNAVANLGLALNQLSADSRRLTNQINFNAAFSDATTTGLGGIIDADLTKASAQLNAAQARQQLTFNDLAIANQSPDYLLNLLP